MQVRKVVTGHDAKGRAVFVRDEQVDGMPIPGLGELAFLWNADEPATYPNVGNNSGAPGIFAPEGGIRFIMSTYLPGGVVAPEPTSSSSSSGRDWSLFAKAVTAASVSDARHLALPSVRSTRRLKARAEFLRCAARCMTDAWWPAR